MNEQGGALAVAGSKNVGTSGTGCASAVGTKDGTAGALRTGENGRSCQPMLSSV